MLSTSTTDAVVDHGLGLGADFAEIFVERSLTNVVSTLSQQVQSVESGIDLVLVYACRHRSLWLHK